MQNIIAKHANNCDFRRPIPTLNWISQVYCLATYDVINCDVHFKMFRYNSAANYQPNGGRYLQVLSGKDLYKQTIVVSSKDTFPARFLNIFVDYPLGQMRVGDKLWTHWNEHPMRLWQTQLNFVVWCASSACGVSSAHLNYSKHPMIRAVYPFHVRRILKRLQVPLPHETGFNTANNPYTESEFLKICEDYRVPNDPIRYRDEKFYWTYQCGVHWLDDYIGPMITLAQ